MAVCFKSVVCLSAVLLLVGVHPAISETSRAAAGIDPAAYARLLEENQTLRRRAEAMSERVSVLESARSALQADAARLQAQVGDLMGRLDNLRRERTVATAELTSLRETLDDRERERTRLARDLERLRERERRLLEGIQTGTLTGEAPHPETVSDLVRDRDRENTRLREALDQLQDQVDTLRRQRDTALALIEDAVVQMNADRRTAKAEQQRLSDRLAELEYEHARGNSRLRAALRDRDGVVARLESEVASLHRQRDRQSHAALPAGGLPAGVTVGRLTESPASGESRLSSDERRRRDMQFNTGVMEARAGRRRSAARAYLAALAIDSADAGARYNLAILYDHELGEPDRARRHYAAYLEQHPWGSHAAAVKSRLMELDMQR